MDSWFQRINCPELFFGFVAPVGANIDGSVDSFTRYFRAHGYNVVNIKVTDSFRYLQRLLKPKLKLKSHPAHERYESYISYGDQLRNDFDDDSILAIFTIIRIIRSRVKTMNNFTNTVYFLHQFKRREEIELLRSVYGRLFFQISVYSRRGVRVDNLSRTFARTSDTAGANLYRDKAEKIVKDDENEKDKEHGQRVGQTFHDADFFVNTDVRESIDSQVDRLCELIFGSNKISPTRIEYGMFLAKAAALRTLDLSRQVGAAIFSEAGDILSLGCNEVPTATGGSYCCDDGYDDRDYRRGTDSNDQRKRAILSELLKLLGKSNNSITKLMKDDKIKNSQLMDALEYGRIVHAEMNALIDAARVGTAVRRGILYGTTFPCHMCAKHIVASGLSKVVFLEPYPKSLASDLHSDAIQIESGDRGKYQDYPFVRFEHFFGVSPRRYRELFERTRRKDDDGNFEEYIKSQRRPIMDYKFPLYVAFEDHIARQVPKKISSLLDKDPDKKPRKQH